MSTKDADIVWRPHFQPNPTPQKRGQRGAAQWRNYLPTQDRPAVPEREALYALYDAVVTEINATRGNLLATPFYLKIRDAVRGGPAS